MSMGHGDTRDICMEYGYGTPGHSGHLYREYMGVGQGDAGDIPTPDTTLLWITPEFIQVNP